MLYSQVCGTGNTEFSNTEFSPPSCSNRELLARAAVCQCVTCCGAEATKGSEP